ncbi:hypothetical protein C0993_005842 [Termitomyces sp. T159_Od127]|nr:hypothetical protein C0993_005842 [Termitomyces sp. T159_Od127]
MATCHDPEGWRIISRVRDFDTSLCFEEGVLLSGLLAALLVVATASWYLLCTKLALLLASLIVSVSNLLFVLLVRKSVPVVYSYVIEPLALASAISLTYLNHTRTRTSSSTLLIFWPLYLFSLTIWIRSVLLTRVDDGHIILALKSIVGALGLVSFALEIFGPEYDVVHTLGDKLHMESPLNTANIFSIWSFGWMTSLMKKGASQYITETDLPSLQLHDESEKLGKDLENALEKHTLWKALFVAYGGPYAVAALLKVFQDCLAFLQPQLLRWLLSYISWYQSARFGGVAQGPSSLEGFAIAGIMFVASVAQTVALNQYFQRTFETGMRVRAGLVTVIYAKALVLSNDERSRASGDIVNLMSVDATRLQDLCTYGLIALSGPLQITLAFISLYDLLGCIVPSILILLELIDRYLTVIARALKRMQVQQMKNRDKRTRLMSELLANIKSIKLYAWEYSFMRKIFETRNNQELKMLRKIGIVTAFNTTLWSGIPLLVGFSSFATAAAVSSKPLTSDTVELLRIDTHWKVRVRSLSRLPIADSIRILNLFSRDTYVVDQILGRVIQGMCRTLAVCLSIVVVIGASFPPFLIAVIPLGLFYGQVMKYYLATSRELKRLDAVSRSPIFAWFSESLAGLSTIRAFNQQSLFMSANQQRIDRNQICYLPSISVNRWLAVRLEFVGAMIILIVALLAMTALITTGVDAGLVGLVLSYALNTTSSLNWVVRSASEVEQNIVSVERILHQTEVPPEAPQEVPENKPSDVWPSHGEVEFRHYSTKYRPELDFVLKDISLVIKPKEKIGVCGRTGAGKSSLLLALFRIIEPVEGKIFIDSVDITMVGLHDLRSNISIVPQSPDLFEGTLRENIDPVGEHTDADIWNALSQAHLKDYVDTLPQGLDAPSKILVLDEATSAVDLDTDRAIQEIIRGPAFADVTMLTIAHRLNTIVESDRVLVMDSGKVAEFDKPETLLAKKESIFYSLAKEAGLV